MHNISKVLVFNFVHFCHFLHNWNKDASNFLFDQGNFSFFCSFICPFFECWFCEKEASKITLLPVWVVSYFNLDWFWWDGKWRIFNLKACKTSHLTQNCTRNKNVQMSEKLLVILWRLREPQDESSVYTKLAFRHSPNFVKSFTPSLFADFCKILLCTVENLIAILHKTCA